MRETAPVGKTNSVRDYLSQMIASGRYPPGGRLPTERALAEQLSVPRGVVRNALAVLESEGLLVRRIGSGTFVSEDGRGGVVKNEVSSDAVDTSPAEIMDGRILFEPRLAGLAVAHATASDFNMLESCNRNAESAKTFEDFEYWDAALHQAIAEATHNRFVIEIFEKISQARNRADWGELKRRSLTAERREEYEADHRRIVAALRERDAAKAEAEMLGHLHRVRRNLLSF